jgi:hypothetical protein
MTRILVATAGDGDDEVYVIPAFNSMPPNIGGIMVLQRGGLTAGTFSQI